MAGLGEACSHIAALLFTTEGTQTKKRLTCTSLPLSSLPSTFRTVPFAKLADTDFSTPLQKWKKITLLNKDESSRSSQPIKQAPTEEVQEAYSVLAKTGKPVVLSLVPKHCETFVSLSAKGVLPQPLTHLFHTDYIYVLSHLELLDVC